MSGTGRRGGFNPLIAGFIAGVALAIVLGLLAKINLDLAAPWSTTHTLTAYVSDVDGISVSSDVRIAGRLVGQITDVQSKGSYSAVTFHVDDGDWPLPRATSASIRLATLLGQKYLQLNPGPNSSQMLSDNAVIGLPSTKPVVDFDQLLSSFDQPTRNALTSLIRTAGSAVQGQEGTLQQLLPNLRDLSVHSVIPTQELVSRNAEINNILINLGTTADQLNASASDLVGVLDNTNSITSALASHQAALEGYIANTDALNRSTDQVLGNGGAAQLDAAFQKLSTFTSQLDTLMTTLVPETYHFATDTGVATGQPVWRDAVNLVWQIGSATAESDKSGFFLRQNSAGTIDPCGLLGPTCVATPGPPGGTPGGGGPIPCIPPLPCLPTGPSPLPSLPAFPTPAPAVLPTLPALPSFPILPSATPGPTNSSSGGPTIPPLPTTLPTLFPGQLASESVSDPATWFSGWSWL